MCTSIKPALESYRDVMKEEMKQMHEQKDTDRVLVEKAATQVQSRLDKKNNMVVIGVPEHINRKANIGLR